MKTIQLIAPTLTMGLVCVMAMGMSYAIALLNV